MAVASLLMLSACSSAPPPRSAAGIESGGTSASTSAESASAGPSADPTPSEAPTSVVADQEEAVGVASGEACADATRWMGCMFPRGDVKVTDISMPGSHDSATWTIDSNGEFAWNCGDNNARKFAASIVTRWARTQEVSPAAAAAAGARYFDLRPFFARDGSLKTCHSYIGASMSDAVGRSGGFVDFAQSHPSEIFLIDFNGTFADQNDAGSPAHVRQLQQWVADELGEVVFGPEHTPAASLSGVSLAEMREARRNVIVLGFGDLTKPLSTDAGDDRLIWDRNANSAGRNLYSCWTDDSDAAKAWWASGTDEGESSQAVMKYIQRELDCLKKAPGGSVNVLNFIVDTSCPFDAAYCGGAWLMGDGTVQVTKKYFDPLVRALARRVGQTGTPAVIMRDVANTSENKWIWNINKGLEN